MRGRATERDEITPQQRAKLERERRKHRERDWRRHVACYTAEFVGTLIVTLGSFAPVALQDGNRDDDRLLRARASVGRAYEPDHDDPRSRSAATSTGRASGDTSRCNFLVRSPRGAIVLGILHPDRSLLHAKLALGPWPAFWLEIVLTVILVVVALSTANKARFIGPQTAFANGATTVFDRLIGYHVSTGSMNPARTLGPALLLGGTKDWWVFTFGPLIGAAIAVFLVDVIQGGPNEAEAQHSAGIEGA